ncbi:hypothetical protein ABZT02_40900 [Streptomyces sp. NPDC005402]
MESTFATVRLRIKVPSASRVVATPTTRVLEGTLRRVREITSA